MNHHEVLLELVKDGSLCAKVYCTAKAAKYLMIGFGLEPRPVFSLDEPCEAPKLEDVIDDGKNSKSRKK